MCQLKVCPSDERGPCGGAERGLCLDGVCQCTGNHTGVGCELQACPRGCSDKGYCGADGRCHDTCADQHAKRPSAVAVGRKHQEIALGLLGDLFRRLRPVAHGLRARWRP